MKRKVDIQIAQVLLSDDAEIEIGGEVHAVSSIGRDRDGRWYVGLGHADNDGARKVVDPAVVVYLPAMLSVLGGPSGAPLRTDDAVTAEIRHDRDRCDVIGAARRQRSNGYGGMAWICDVADDLGTSVMSLTPTLLSLHRSENGGILQRADLVQSMDSDKVQRSEIRHPMLESACYHLVVVR